MPLRSTTTSLNSLFEYLDGLESRAGVEDLRVRLDALEVDTASLAEYVRFHDAHYLRNLIRQGPQYHMLALCWRSGQRSPIHNHAGSTCGLRVLQGVATETMFETTPSGLIHATDSLARAAGDVAVSQDADIHQVSNLQAPGNDLVTLHIYSPPLLRMDTYSLTDHRIGEYRPMVLEHVHGSGI